MANICSKENVDKDDENLTFEFVVNFDFLEKIVAKGGHDFDEVNQRKLKVKRVTPNSLHIHLIV